MTCLSTHILDLELLAIPRPKVGPEGPPKQLLEHLKADARVTYELQLICLRDVEHQWEKIVRANEQG